MKLSLGLAVVLIFAATVTMTRAHQQVGKPCSSGDEPKSDAANDGGSQRRRREQEGSWNSDADDAGAGDDIDMIGPGPAGLLSRQKRDTGNHKNLCKGGLKCVNGFCVSGSNTLILKNSVLLFILAAHFVVITTLLPN